MNDLDRYATIFDGIKPWAGYVPKRFIADFLGQLIDIDFHPMLFTDPAFDGDTVGGGWHETLLPDLGKAVTTSDAEAWFEAVDWVVAAREARDHYTMITLGANYGAQAVGAQRALQAVNPLPYKLVAVEPVPDNYEWLCRHMRNNGIDPAQQWLVPLAISDTTAPLFFPVGGAGIGSNNCYSTNELAARRDYAEGFIRSGRAEEALRNLLLHNTTGLTKDLVDGHDFKGEIKLISSITLNELLGPFERIDLLESDIQQSEILVFPPCIELLGRKVRRIHIGTHGGDVHETLHRLFADAGWEIVFSYAPNSHFDSALGPFATNDGVLTVRNPRL
jgi:FkbM family methyltransferase